MAIFEELVHLLTYDHPIICAKACTHFLKLLQHLDYVLFSLSARYEGLHGFQVIHSDEIKFLRLNCHLHLILQSHYHQIVKFLHASIIELHDGTMGQLFKDSFCRIHFIHGLRAEKLANKLICKHATNNIIEDLNRSFLCNILRTQTLIQDIDHLTA